LFLAEVFLAKLAATRRSGRMLYRVYLEQDEDGVFVATCPALPGCVSQGRTRAEAIDNVREAIEGYIKSLTKHGEPVAPSILEEIIEVAGG
jgi:predicted RNase H-like HicB family nuclease